MATTAGTVAIQSVAQFPVGPYLVILFVLLVVGTFQWASFLNAKFGGRRRFSRDEESAHVSKRTSSTLGLPLAVVNYYRVLAFRTTVGFRSYVFNLAEVCAAVGYVALLFVFTFIIDSSPEGAPLNWCSRAALLAASQFLFVTVLGTKNNIISMVTRLGPDKLNILHRVAARACLMLIGLHVLGGDNNFPFYESGSGDFILFGKIAAIVFVALAVVSLRPIRERAYELFFYFHYVAVIVIMVAAMMHISMYGATNVVYYIWPSFVIWAVDRLMRVGRLIYVNLPQFGSGSRFSTLDATTELLDDSLVRVRFRRPDRFHWSPGQFAYLIMPSVSRLPFEAHPFSIASVDSLLFAPDLKAGEDFSGRELVFIIGVKNGFTKRLKDVAARGEKVKVYIDGPYGDGVDLARYDTSLLIVGGTGITFALPALLGIIESVRNGSCCRRVVLVWSIRDAGILNWVSESLNKAIRFAPPELKVDIQVFVTKGRRPHLSSTAMESGASLETMPLGPFEDQNPFLQSPSSPSFPDKDILEQPWLTVTNGRPDLGHILDDEIDIAKGKVSVSVCGPSAMTRDVRKALQFPWRSPSSPLSGGPSVTLHVETFGYA